MAPKTLKAQTPTGRPRTGYRRSDETRSRILEAALAEATEAGFQGTSVARIAARAGVAVGVLNYHFGSKEELLRQSMVGLIKDFRSQLVFASTVKSDDFFQRERAGLLIYLAYLRANPSNAQLAEEVRLHDPVLYQRGVEAWIKDFILRVRCAIKEGSLEPIPDSEIRIRGYFVLGAYQFLDRLIESDPYPGDEPVVDIFLNMIRSGMGFLGAPETGPTRSQALASRG